jgi:hypothetical protein
VHRSVTLAIGGVALLSALAACGGSGSSVKVQTPVPHSSTDVPVAPGSAPAPVFKRELEAQIKSDLRNGATAEEVFLTDNVTYATSMTQLAQSGFRPTADIAFRIVSAVGTDHYCLAATGGTETLYYDSAHGGLLPLGSSCA